MKLLVYQGSDRAEVVGVKVFTPQDNQALIGDELAAEILGVQAQRPDAFADFQVKEIPEPPEE